MFVRFNYIAWEQKSLISFHWTTVFVNKRRFSIGIFEFHAAISLVHRDVPQDIDVDLENLNKCVACQFNVKY